MAATALLAANALNPSVSNAGNNDHQRGGLKEWTTDQDIDAKSTLDEAAQEEEKKAKEEDICIPVGEGENCW